MLDTQYWPLPPGIGLIIEALVEAITQNQQTIDSLSQQVNHINGVKIALESARSVESPLSATLASLSGSWSEVTTQTNDLVTFLNAIDKLPELDETFAPVIHQSWVTLSSKLSAW